MSAAVQASDASDREVSAGMPASSPLLESRGGSKRHVGFAAAMGGSGSTDAGGGSPSDNLNCFSSSMDAPSSEVKTPTQPLRLSRQPHATSAPSLTNTSEDSSSLAANVTPGTSVVAIAPTKELQPSSSAEIPRLVHTNGGGSGEVAHLSSVIVSNGGQLPLSSKSIKRPHNSGPSAHTHRKASLVSSSAECRTSAERCKAARVLAAELMSTLMEHPPDAAMIARYRASLKSSGASSTSPSAVATSETTAERLHGPRLTSSKEVELPPTDGGALSAAPRISPSHSFLEVVRKGHLGMPRTSSSGAPPPSSTALTSESASTVALLTPQSTVAAVTLKSSRRRESPTGHADPSSTYFVAHTAADALEKSACRPLVLIPDDVSTISQLIRELREVAFSCVSLDAVSKSSSTPPSNLQSLSALMVPTIDVAVPAKDACRGASDSGSIAVLATATSLSASRHSGQALDAVEEEHWRTARAHFKTVCGLVLNAHELIRTLDETFGMGWGEVRSEAMESAASEEAIDSRATSSKEEALHHAPEAACACLTLRDPVVVPVGRPTPVIPTPIGRATSPPPSKFLEVTGSAAAATSAAAAPVPAPAVVAIQYTKASPDSSPLATAAVSTALNYNAPPFHSRTPPRVQPLLQGHPSPTPSASPNPAAHPRDAGTSRPLTNAKFSSMQLSEKSPTYSPSQQVITFLERTTPPHLVHTQDEAESALPNFPSTPLSELAAPYQPSPSLMNTSPRGASASTASAPFHLESREEMLRRRSAAPNAFYASMTHNGATHFLSSSSNAAKTPGSLVSSTLTPGVPPFSLNGDSRARSLPVSPLMTFTSLATPACPYDYLLVLDFEATCEENPPPNYLHEIIEFPVVVVDVRMQRVVAEFHRFVRPRYKRELSLFCKELTGLQQEDVDSAAPLEDIIVQFERWLAHTLPSHSRYVFVTDGPTDLREFMYHHSVCRQSIRFPILFYQFIDVKQTFALFFQCAPGKIRAMLEVLNLPFQGRLHSGIDDARNIASIVIGLLQYGCSFCEIPLHRLPFNGRMPAVASANASGSSPLSLPPSTATAASRRLRPATSAIYTSAPYSVDGEDFSKR